MEAHSPPSFTIGQSAASSSSMAATCCSSRGGDVVVARTDDAEGVEAGVGEGEFTAGCGAERLRVFQTYATRKRRTPSALEALDKVARVTLVSFGSSKR